MCGQDVLRLSQLGWSSLNSEINYITLKSVTSVVGYFTVCSRTFHSWCGENCKPLPSSGLEFALGSGWERPFSHPSPAYLHPVEPKAPSQGCLPVCPPQRNQHCCHLWIHTEAPAGFEVQVLAIFTTLNIRSLLVCTACAAVSLYRKGVLEAFGGSWKYCVMGTFNLQLFKNLAFCYWFAWFECEGRIEKSTQLPVVAPTFKWLQYKSKYVSDIN